MNYTNPQPTIETTDICAMATVVFGAILMNLFEIISYQPSTLSEISTSPLGLPEA